MQDIHDIKPIIDPGMDLGWLIWVGAALLVLVLIALAWWLWRRRRRPAADEPQAIPLPSPEAEAHAGLDELAADRSLDGKQYYFRLSAVHRRYMERRYDFPAAEMTLEELLPRVAQLPLAEALKQPLTALCRRAEPIKFADAAADPHQMTEDLRFVREFVTRTTPAQQPADSAPNDEPTNRRIDESTNQRVNESTN